MKKTRWTLYLILVSIMSSYADKTIYINTTVQGNGDGTTPATACKIKTATAVANLAATGITTIVFPSNATFQVTTSDGVEPANGCITIPNSTTKKIIFEGNNSIILGSSGTAVRLLRLGSSTDIELRNLTFRNGTHTGTVGGGVYFGGANLIISGCTFDNCTSDNGGAFASRGTNVTIRNSYFINNKLLNGSRGAAITNTGTTSGGTFLVENTTFNNNNNNTAGSGLACYGTAICTAFDNYSAGNNRGYLNTITINNCTFYKNLTGLNSSTGCSAVYLDELSGGTTSAVFTNNTFYGNNNAAINIIGIKQTVTLVNNVIVGDSWATVSGGSYQDHGVIAGSTIAAGRPAITGKNNYIVAKNPIGATNITEASFQSGTNGNTFVTTTAQSVIDAVYLNPTLSATSVPYLTITNASSPLVNAGISTLSGITIPSTDITGFQRTPNYTIGAYQATLNVANGTTQTINQNVNLLSAIVKPTGKLTLAAGKILTTGMLTIRSDETGTGTFVDNGGVLESTTTTVKQYLSSARNWYISSPVTGATAFTGFSFFTRDEATNIWPALNTGDALNFGQGYIVTLASGTDTLSFSGTLNTGSQSITVYRTPAQIAKPGFNLIGNPYPSYLNARTLINSSANLEKSIWYRTQVKNSSTYKFDTYNTAGGLGTNNTNNNPWVIGTVPPMQAFWVRVSENQTSATLNFSNALRSHANDTVNPLKTRALNNSAQSVLRLQVSNGINTDEALIYFNDKASNSYDSYDSPKMSNSSASIPEIYTMLGVEKLAINGLNSLSTDIELPLGFTSGKANTFSIKASEIPTLDSVEITLKDKLLNKEFNLKNGNVYTFPSDAITTETRFAILFKIQYASTAIKSALDGTNIRFLADTGRLTIINEDVTEKEIPVSIYNSIGQHMTSFNLTQTTTVLGTHFTSGVYVISLKLKDGISAHKVIVQ